jgi:hypothetical protein
MKDLAEWNFVEIAMLAMADSIEHWLVTKELGLREEQYVVPEDFPEPSEVSQLDPLSPESWEQPNFSLNTMCSKGLKVVR